MQVAFKKGKDHVENIFYLQGQEQVHCTGKRNHYTGAGSEIGVDAKEIKTEVLQWETLLDRMQEKESK